ncbi:MAG: hypothetical protein WBD89_12645 [Candidatus Sulfotelmatobacter sp.]
MKTNDTHESVSRIAGRGLVLAGLLAVALALTASSFAQSNASAAPKVADAKAAQPSANSPSAEARKTPRGTGEGIQIHGWWTIEIRNRDGSVAKHVEFENALVAQGPSVLAGLLSGNLVAGSWQLLVGGTTSPCSTSPVAACEILTAGSSLANPGSGCTTAVVAANPQPFCYATLTPSLSGNNEPYAYSSFALDGQAYADTSTSITVLQSFLAACGSQTVQVVDSTNTLSPSACYASPDYISNLFTEYDFGQPGACGGTGQLLCPIPIQAGQIIAANVQFSFSSPSSGSGTSDLARPRPILKTPNPAQPPASTPVTH